jgi:TolB protein
MVAAPSAHATFPGANGKIAFVRGHDIWSMNPDGTDQVNLTNSPVNFQSSPAWSPDGTKIVFTSYTPQYSTSLWTMRADGSNPTKISDNSFGPSWSPDGTQISFGYGGPFYDGVGKMNADGTGRTNFFSDYEDLEAVIKTDWSPDGSLVAYDGIWVDPTCGPNGYDVSTKNPNGPGGSRSLTATPGPCGGCRDELSPSWSPDAQRIAFTSAPLNSDGCQTPTSPYSIWTIKPDATGRQQLTNPSTDQGSPAWSPDGQKIAFGQGARIEVMNADGTAITDITDGGRPAWQPIPINSYPRPRGATPFRASLVPANEQCTAPNTTHGAPLSFGSCTPPQLASGQLTTGTPDSNGLPVRMDAFLELRVGAGDVQIDAHLNDVMNKDLSDYSGSLRAELPLRITDKDNTPSPGGPGAGTTQPFQYGFDIPCVPDPAPTLGSDCSIATTANSLVPGTIKPSLRTIWQIGRVRVDDAGPDGNPDTTADNTVFAVQGVFVP